MKLFTITEEQYLEFIKNVNSKHTPESGQLYCSMHDKGFCSYEGKDGKCKVEGKCVNHIIK